MPGPRRGLAPGATRPQPRPPRPPRASRPSRALSAGLSVRAVPHRGPHPVTPNALQAPASVPPLNQRRWCVQMSSPPARRSRERPMSPLPHTTAPATKLIQRGAERDHGMRCDRWDRCAGCSAVVADAPPEFPAPAPARPTPNTLVPATRCYAPHRRQVQNWGGKFVESHPVRPAGRGGPGGPLRR
jgi:hypothetical protein